MNCWGTRDFLEKLQRGGGVVFNPKVEGSQYVLFPPSHNKIWKVFFKFQVMWVLPWQPISMFGIFNPSLCGRACIWWSKVTPNLFANAKNISLTSPDCQQNKVSFLVWFGNAILILMHNNTAKVDFEYSLQHTVVIMLLLMLILVVACIDILVSIFLLYVIWFSDSQFMKGIYFRGRNI